MYTLRHGQVLSDHGAVKGDQAGGIGEPGQQCGDVAITHENFGVALELGEVQFLQQVVCSVAATGANDGANVIALKHLLQFAGAASHRAGEVEVAVEDGVVVERLVAEAAQTLAAGQQQVALDGAAGRDDANRIAGAQRRRLDARVGWICHGRPYGPRYSVPALPRTGACPERSRRLLGFTMTPLKGLGQDSVCALRYLVPTAAHTRCRRLGGCTAAATEESRRGK